MKNLWISDIIFFIENNVINQGWPEVIFWSNLPRNLIVYQGHKKQQKPDRELNP